MKIMITVLVGFLMSLPQLVFGQGVENFSLEAVVEDSKTQIASKFELKDHRGKTVVLHFLLKTECPFCLKYTNQYALLAATTPEVVHLFIKPDSEKEINAWLKKLVKIEGFKRPVIYRDAGATLAKKFGVPFGYQFHGQTIHYPAMIVLDGNGKEMFRHVGTSNSDRMPKEEFIKKLESMLAK